MNKIEILSPLVGSAWAAEIVSLARRLVESFAFQHSDAPTLAIRLAEEVGKVVEPSNRLVAAALAGGPFAARRALEIAEIVLRGTSANSCAIGVMVRE